MCACHPACPTPNRPTPNGSAPRGADFSSPNSPRLPPSPGKRSLTALRVPAPCSLSKEVCMKVLFINNSGGGFADFIEVGTGTTVAQLFGQRLPHAKAEDSLIRVNRELVS